MPQARAEHDTRSCGGAWPRCPWAAAGPGQASHSDLAPLVRRAPEEPESPAAVLVGNGGAWPGFEPTHKHTSAHRAPLVWRAPEGPEGLAAVPVGGGGAWPG